jgi:hypothetical protein
MTYFTESDVIGDTERFERNLDDMMTRVRLASAQLNEALENLKAAVAGSETVATENSALTEAELSHAL